MSADQVEEYLVATLGTEPQVVTIALDALINFSHHIRETIVIYTDSPSVVPGVSLIEQEFAAPRYSGINLKLVPVTGSNGPVRDFKSSTDLDALLETLYQVIHSVKERKGLINLSISGGRKVMGIIGMVAAQFLFKPQDHVWYLFTEGWRPGSERVMHYDQRAHLLVEVPVLRWDDSSLMFNLAEKGNPADLLHWQENADRIRKLKRAREFIEHWLTRAEREVVVLVCQGFDNESIAFKLHKSTRTVANQLNAVYGKLDELLGFPGSHVDRTTLLTELAPFFMLSSEGDLLKSRR